MNGLEDSLSRFSAGLKHNKDAGGRGRTRVRPAAGGLRRGGGFEQIAGVAQDGIGRIPAAEHPGDLLDAGGAVEPVDQGAGSALGDLLAHGEVGGAADRDLGQMGDADHLVMPGHLLEFGADGSAHFPADIGIDLVENQQGNAVLSGEHRLGGEHDAGNLPAGGDGAQGADGFAHIGGEGIFDGVQPGGAGLDGGELNRQGALGKAEVA